jgi:phosphoglycerate dehydrogenase-like enzyme
MTKPRTVMLITREMQRQCFADADIARLADLTDFQPAQHDELDETSQLAAITGADIIITGWGTLAITPAMLDAAPGLKLMCHSAGSIKHLIDEQLVARGIRVVSAASALAVGVAEFTFAMMLTSMKAAWQCYLNTLDGKWDRSASQHWVREPYGAVVGIVGASFVGREMIRLCKSLSLKAILLYDPYVSDDRAEALGVEKVDDLDDLMRRSDVVSLHTPNTDECEHIINARNLALMRDHAIFINTSRGRCLDEAALIAELEKGRLWACLDVTEPEPPEPGSPLYSLPNCVLTPHIAGSVKENCHRQGNLVTNQVEAYVRKGQPDIEVDLSQLHRLA